MTGDLKCGHCGRITRHALLREDDGHRDAAEEFQRVALGGEPTDRYTDAARMRRQYRDGLPRNPYLHHLFWGPEARETWAAGLTTVATLCGGTMELDCDPDSDSSSQMIDYAEPREIRNQEYEDPDKGLWWVEMDCVDCLRLANLWQLKQQRRELLSELLELTAAVERMDPQQVAGIREYVGRLLAG